MWLYNYHQSLQEGHSTLWKTQFTNSQSLVGQQENATWSAANPSAATKSQSSAGEKLHWLG